MVQVVTHIQTKLLAKHKKKLKLFDLRILKKKEKNIIKKILVIVI